MLCWMRPQTGSRAGSLARPGTVKLAQLRTMARTRAQPTCRTYSGLLRPRAATQARTRSTSSRGRPRRSLLQALSRQLRQRRRSGLSRRCCPRSAARGAAAPDGQPCARSRHVRRTSHMSLAPMRPPTPCGRWLLLEITGLRQGFFGSVWKPCFVRVRLSARMAAATVRRSASRTPTGRPSPAPRSASFFRHIGRWRSTSMPHLRPHRTSMRRIIAAAQKRARPLQRWKLQNEPCERAKGSL
mmetsp:Transcript_12666/g.53258  ORF Transcript_12666/g.53258 Transcript_12666/m.53258 type:complete len:242 (+) Transcript_12666:945-1670(+)